MRPIDRRTGAIGGTPLSNLGDHLADPGHANLVGNGGIPWLLYGL